MIPFYFTQPWYFTGSKKPKDPRFPPRPAPDITKLVDRYGWWETPSQGVTPRPPIIRWAADNGCFSDSWDPDKWWTWLGKVAVRHPDMCAFAVAPDVFADPDATLERSTPWIPRIHALGLPVAYVYQDGAKIGGIPWDEFEVMFIGGNPESKYGPAARVFVAEAKRRGKQVHIGGVGSLKRLRYAEAIGADSCDGTGLAIAPDTNMARIEKMINNVHDQHPLFDLAENNE